MPPDESQQHPVAPTRYRRPGDAIRAAAAALVLLALVAPALLAPDLVLGSAGGVLGGPAALAVAAVLLTVLGPWTTRYWRWAGWSLLAVVAAARVAAGADLPLELLLALGAGVLVGSGLLIAVGAPDRRMGPDGVAAALAAGGVPVRLVAVAPVQGKGSRSLVAVGDDGRRRFVKVLGRDERDADLLYRDYRFLHLRGVDDVRRAATLRQAVEHQALVAVMAERAGVRVRCVERVVESGDGSVLLVMDLVDAARSTTSPPRTSPTTSCAGSGPRWSGSTKPASPTGPSVLPT